MTTDTPEFYAILTNEGLKLQFECLSDNNKKFEMSEIAIGDGNGSYYEPEKSQTKLKNEVYRHSITRRITDSDKLLKSVILDIPEDVSGFTIREVGVFGKDGKLLIVGKYPATERKSSLSGAIFQHAVKIDLDVIDSTILPLIDPSINTASVEYVGKYFQKLAEKSQAGGYPELDENGTIPESQLPKVYADLELSNLNSTGKAKLDAKADKTYVESELSKKANVSLNNLDDIGADKLNTSKMYTTGVVSEDTQGFTQLQQMRRSTFDLSKFTVVGSPTITDEGVASGFDSSNYLTVDTSIFANDITDFDFYISFKITKITTKRQHITRTIYNGSFRFLVCIDTDGAVKFNFSTINVETVVIPSNELVLNKEYIIKLSLHNGVLEYGYFTDNTYTTKGTVVVSYIARMGFFPIGFSSMGSLTDGSIDLSHFSITVDGKEVFSGNKTGLDVIKPDNYTVVGSPVITDDGVASGLNHSINKISKLIDVSNFYGHNLKFTNRGLVQKGKRTVFFNFAPTYNDTTLCLYCESECAFILAGRYLKNDDTNGAIWTAKNVTSLLNDDVPHWCTATAEFNASTNAYTITLTREDNGQSLSVTKIITDAKYNNASPRYFNGLTTATVYIGNNHWTDESDTIDLNAFKIYVDGNLVYQPCLKIPYTESKTGSKIVDEVYRDRVIDLYEQEGQAGYYTIDEENQNFTLPMGEIYGMIEEKATKNYIESELSKKVDTSSLEECQVVIDTYQNGTSGYRIWSDGYCKQWGRTQVSPKQDITVTFLKEFKNTDYTVSHTVERYSSTAVSKTDDITVLINSVSTIGMGFYSFDVGDNTYTTYTRWEVSGYLAEGEY